MITSKPVMVCVAPSFVIFYNAYYTPGEKGSLLNV